VKSILTGTDDAKIIKRLHSMDIAENWKKAFSIDVGDNFKRLGFIDYLQCNATGFKWYSPHDAAGGAELYEQLQKYDWYYMKNKWEFSVALDLIKEVNSVLEVGVGEGHFLSAARNAGFNVQGVELNPKGAEKARSLGFHVYEKMLQDIPLATEKRFDVICSFQVLEHVPDPNIFLNGMISLLRPGGRIILSVPNAAVMRSIDPNNQDLLNQPPHHMGHWDEGVFRALECYLPLKVKSVHLEPLADYHIGWFITGYLRNLLSPLGKNISRLLVNRFSTLPLQWLMRAGFKKFCKGHTLLVELEHCPK